MGVIGLDLSIETALKAVVSSLNERKQPADDFNSLVQQANHLTEESGLGSIPMKARIQHLHTLRNDAQHKARYPNEQDAAEARASAYGFLRALTKQVWAVDFDDVSLVDLVADGAIRSLLVQSAEDISDGRLMRGLALAARALDLAGDQVAELHYFFGSVVGTSFTRDLDFHTQRTIDRGLQAVRDNGARFAALISVMGSVADYRRFLASAPFITYSSSTEIDSGVTRYGVYPNWRDGEPTLEDARWAHNFAVSRIVSWQMDGHKIELSGSEDEARWSRLLCEWSDRAEEE
jgi:hypothetical protein